MSKSVELSEYQKMTYFHRAASARLIISSWKSKFTSSSGVSIFWVEHLIQLVILNF